MEQGSKSMIIRINIVNSRMWFFNLSNRTWDANSVKSFIMNTKSFFFRASILSVVVVSAPAVWFNALI